MLLIMQPLLKGACLKPLSFKIPLAVTKDTDNSFLITIEGVPEFTSVAYSEAEISQQAVEAFELVAEIYASEKRVLDILTIRARK